MKMHTKFLYLFALGSMMLTLLLLTVSTYLLFFHMRAPLTYNNLPAPVSKTIYQPGENLTWTIDYCLAYEGGFEAYLTLFGPETISYPVVHAVPTPKGCYILDRTIMLPTTLQSGSYILIGRLVFKVNPLATREVAWQTKPFFVTPH